MLTKLVARNESVSESPSIYLAAFEHEHRRAEHEHEHEIMPEQSVATVFSGDVSAVPSIKRIES